MSLHEKRETAPDQGEVPGAPIHNIASVKSEQNEEKDPVATDVVYPSGLKLALLMTSVFVAMFLVSLDRLIVATAVPQITNEFNSAGDIGWYATAYLLTSCAFQLLFGKLYKVFSIKITFLSSIVLFEIGSAICGSAPNSIALIIGRAISGLGSGGILSGVLVIVVYAVPLHKRPKFQGFFGAVFGIASVTGPIIGGALTTHASWRWCFYLNLPLGGLVIGFIVFLLDIPDQPNTKMPMKQKLEQLNILGLFALVPGIICLCLALTWGGTTYAWAAGRIIALLTVAFVLLITFVATQILKPAQAIMPPRIFTQRSIASGFWVSCCLGAHLNMIVYYLPVWFQAIEGVTAIASGIRTLPLVIPLVLSSILTGIAVSKIGYYTPFLIFGTCLTTIGIGLLTTFDIHTTQAKWIGTQFAYGFALGFCSQAPNMAAQTVLPKEDVAIGASLMFFGQTLFGAVFTSVGQNVLDNQLTKRLAGIPGISAKVVVQNGATDLLRLVPEQFREMALVAYNESLRRVFQVGLIMACLSILGAASMEWRSVKKNLPKKEKSIEEGAGEGASESKVAEGKTGNSPISSPGTTGAIHQPGNKSV